MYTASRMFYSSAIFHFGWVCIKVIPIAQVLQGPQEAQIPTKILSCVSHFYSQKDADVIFFLLAIPAVTLLTEDRLDRMLDINYKHLHSN